MNFPQISEAVRLERLQPPRGKVRIVLDSDTYHEIDAQFAVSELLGSIPVQR